MGGCNGPFLKSRSIMLNGKSFHNAESCEGKREVTLYVSVIQGEDLVAM